MSNVVELHKSYVFKTVLLCNKCDGCFDATADSVRKIIKCICPQCGSDDMCVKPGQKIIKTDG